MLTPFRLGLPEGISIAVAPTASDTLSLDCTLEQEGKLNTDVLLV